MNRAFLFALGGGLASAILFVAYQTGTPFSLALLYLVPIPLLAAGLSLGVLATTIASGTAAIVLLVGTSINGSLMYIAAVAVPALIVVGIALRIRATEDDGRPVWSPPGMIVGSLCLYGTLVLAGAVLAFAGEEGGLDGASARFLRISFDRLLAGTQGRLAFSVEGLGRYFSGFVVSIWALITLVNAVLAQNMLARAGLARRPTPAYSEIVLPRWLEIGFLGAVLLTFLPGMVAMFGRNAAILLSTPFFILGLAVIHTLSRRLPARGLGLAVVYILLFLMGWLSVLIVLLGLVEQWTSLRGRFSAPGGGSQENE